MLDQCHNIESKIPGQIRSVLNVQEMTARALLVDRPALERAQRAGDVMEANEVFMDAFYTDVRSNLAAWRESRALPAQPLSAYKSSGYGERIVISRLGVSFKTRHNHSPRKAPPSPESASPSPVPVDNPVHNRLPVTETSRSFSRLD